MAFIDINRLYQIASGRCDETSRRWLVLACSLHAGARAQVPESGRFQELSFSTDEVDARMEDRYIDRTVDLAAAGKLDEDRVLLARLQAISAGLIRAAVELKLNRFPAVPLEVVMERLDSDLSLQIHLSSLSRLFGAWF